MSNVFYMQNPSEAKALYCGFALSVPVDDVQVNDQETSKNLKTVLVKRNFSQIQKFTYDILLGKIISYRNDFQFLL